jgi:hypothetical protein
MGALSDLLKQPAIAATPATLLFAGVRTSARVAESQESQRDGLEIRANLLSLADAEGYAPAIVHRLHAEDVAACLGLSNETLRAYLRALDRGTVMDCGIAPAGYTQAVHCDRCGPVWLWQGAPARVVACPWCFRRRAGKKLPRPQVACGDCIQYLPDALNPGAGRGGCARGERPALWPMASHRCCEHAPIETRKRQIDPLMISHSVELPQ